MVKSFWVDKYHKKYKSKDVTDTHILSIIDYIAKGGGFLDFLSHTVIDDIYDEAIIRGLKPKVKRSELKYTYDNRIAECEYLLDEEFNRTHWHGQD